MRHGFLARACSRRVAANSCGCRSVTMSAPGVKICVHALMASRYNRPARASGSPGCPEPKSAKRKGAPMSETRLSSDEVICKLQQLRGIQDSSQFSRTRMRSSEIPIPSFPAAPPINRPPAERMLLTGTALYPHPTRSSIRPRTVATDPGIMPIRVSVWRASLPCIETAATSLSSTRQESCRRFASSADDGQ